MDILSKIVGSITKFFVNERVNDYRTSYMRNQELLAQVTLEMDRALMTFSIASLAALAALNDRVFSVYGFLSFITLVCFIGVVISVILGYYFSRGMLLDAQRIISENFKKSLAQPLGKGINKVRFAKTTKSINFISVSLFITGMICLIVLLGMYIGSSK